MDSQQSPDLGAYILGLYTWGPGLTAVSFSYSWNLLCMYMYHKSLQEPALSYHVGNRNQIQVLWSWWTTKPPQGLQSNLTSLNPGFWLFLEFLIKSFPTSFTSNLLRNCTIWLWQLSHRLTTYMLGADSYTQSHTILRSVMTRIFIQWHAKKGAQVRICRMGNNDIIFVLMSHPQNHGEFSNQQRDYPSEHN